MLDQLLSPQIINQLNAEIGDIVRDAIQKATRTPAANSETPVAPGYLNQIKAQKYVGSKALLEKLEVNGLGRFMIDGTIRYKVSELDEFMEIFRC